MNDSLKEKLHKHSLKQYIGIIILIVVVFGAIISLYSAITTQVINTSINSMEEVATHDEVSIMTSVQWKWDALVGIGAECRASHCKTISELLELLHLKEINLDCLDIALLDEQNTLYMGSMYTTEDAEISELCRSGVKHFAVKNYGIDANVGNRRESLLVGTAITPFTVENHTFDYIICRYHIDTLGNELKIDSYDGAGYSSVIDMNGDYIINLDSSYNLQDSNNFYDTLEDYTIINGVTIEDVRKYIANRESFTLEIEKDGTTLLLRFTPMEEIDWYFVMSVDKSVFEAQSMDILKLVVLIFVIMGVAFVLILLLIFRNRYFLKQAKTESAHKEELTEALVRAEEASRSKTAFLNNMSHDIRTPMNAIIGYTNLALKKLDDKETVKDYLNKTVKSSNHLLSLINDVLDMSRIESGKVVIEEQPENIGDILNNIKDMIQTDIRAKQIDFFMDASNVKDENVMCDRLRLNQILLNLLSNAIKFTPQGGTITVRLLQKESGEPDTGVYELRVKDSGIGMDPEFVKTIFEPFTRERTSTVSGIQGTGLGMSITKTLVDMMGGNIEVISEPNKGTEFIITLKFALVKDDDQKFEPIEQIQGKRVLIVDDDSDSCESICLIMRELGMTPEWTLSGLEAVQKAEESVAFKNPYDLYIIDGVIPDMDGIEIVKRIRDLAGRHVPIVLISAYDWSMLEEKAEEAGVTEFIGKPLLFSKVYKALYKIYQDEEWQNNRDGNEEKADFNGRRLLLVEDNEFNQEIATEILEDANFTVEIASNGEEAVKAVADSKPGYYDAVLMDVQMPVMDGYEATRQIRKFENKDLANIPIIAMTANAFAEDKQTAADSGMNGHIGKPIDVEKLFEILKEFLNKE